ncbi:hypothetical protein POM88_012581 [Heracleum sosnowskyi]|uniref:Uncharacterized protein n=1 Tax=Heracleum sosnowskyi TaxID=360622 RepID=A0AAD8MXG2_9APIA|nr:hypothetical protein POM88_012581 [Heracleum sosnowskyi]
MEGHFDFPKLGNKLNKAVEVTKNNIDGSSVFIALTMAATGISQSGSFAPDKSKSSTATTSIYSILDRKSKIDPCDESGMTLDNGFDSVAGGERYTVIWWKEAASGHCTCHDVIVVLKNGVIVEKGKHEGLMNIKDGFYASLVALQTNTSS